MVATGWQPVAKCQARRDGNAPGPAAARLRRQPDKRGVAPTGEHRAADEHNRRLRMEGVSRRKLAFDPRKTMKALVGPAGVRYAAPSVNAAQGSIGSEFERRTVRSTVETVMLVCRPTWICSEPEEDPSPRVRVNVPALR
jgi:hypothetical protein